MNTNFKTVMFGGFNKEDVIAYIENNAREFNEKIAQLQKDNELLLKENDELQAKVYQLSDSEERLNEILSELEEAKAHIEELEENKAGLEEMVEKLKGPAEEYNGLKEHIADIEISAHKRTEEFRQKAIAELKSMVQKEREWCATTKEAVKAKNMDILDKLKAAETSINECDYTTVEDVISSLSEFEGSLK